MKKKIKYYVVVSILSIITLISLGFLCTSLRQNQTLQNKIVNQDKLIKKQKSQIYALNNTKDVRNYNSMKEQTDNSLNKAANALFTWKGKQYAKRYTKAMKYMDRNVLVGLSTNGSVPTQSDMKQAAKYKEKVDAVSKVTEIENGIQDIKGNTVSGFAWIVMQYGEYNKDNNITVSQIKYKYNLNTKKFTQYQAEPFSGTIQN